MKIDKRKTGAGLVGFGTAIWIQSQCFGGSGSSILGWLPIWIRIQGFDDQNCKKNLQLKQNLIFFEIKNCNLLIPRSHTKVFQAPGEAFSSQKRTSGTSKHDISYVFYFCGTFWSTDLIESGSGSETLIYTYQLTEKHTENIIRRIGTWTGLDSRTIKKGRRRCKYLFNFSKSVTYLQRPNWSASGIWI